ncbi:sorting nexin-7-like isoform X1 [Huso huso]|uniref:Sorting nexin-7-like isoform X1 n=1 Tax=Huso huso TaxID=61971 RepID=A0ABR0ZIR3_HUSHU|nr:sorting nexin-7-like isoform X1 [Acipenser ruthenus]XP_058887689.1 sorting nexin-7-like isoform X1 [Acipenser ruthenus]
MESESTTSSAQVNGNLAQTVADLSKHMLELDEDDDLEVFSKDALINQYKLEEQDIKDVFITVDCPENHVTSIETFVTYRVITKTTRSEFDSSEYEVRRRYQDFLWLKGKLEEAHPTLIINPLPEKFVMKGMMERFNDDFIETRRKALHKFVNRIADHPILSFNEDFKVFLTAQAWELASHKKQGPGLLSRMGETVRAVAASVRGVQNRPEEFTAMNDYVETFSQKMGMLDKIAQRIVKEQKEYLEGMKECGPVYTLWSGSEDQLVEPLKAIAGCIDNCCKVTEEQVAGLSENQVPILHEYVLCAETLKAVLRRRDNIQAEYESKVDALASKKADKENLKHTDLSFVFGGFLGKNTEEAKQQKEQRLDCEMKELKEEIGRLEDKVECANNTLKVDWERWKRNMQSDVKSAFVDMADTNMNYYKKCLAIWESFLTSQKTDVHLEKDTDS